VLFDCAGLVLRPDNILDQLSRQAALEALQNSSVVVFCVDISKTDWTGDVSILDLIKSDNIVPVATKPDMISTEKLKINLQKLADLFGMDFLPVSVETGDGLAALLQVIDERIIRAAGAIRNDSQVSRDMPDTKYGVGLTIRHKQAINEAIKNITEAAVDVENSRDEIAAMMLRSAHRVLLNVETDIDEEILERIFSRFCIGK
jgi:tRNA U34 5-carboxymethylaminomethyl modifying GTPase MnmE/TrmE